MKASEARIQTEKNVELSKNTEIITVSKYISDAVSEGKFEITINLKFKETINYFKELGYEVTGSQNTARITW